MREINNKYKKQKAATNTLSIKPNIASHHKDECFKYYSQRAQTNRLGKTMNSKTRERYVQDEFAADFSY